MDEGAGKPELGAGGWAWTTDWRCRGGRLPLPLPLLTSPPPPACITRTHPPSHTSIHNLTPSSSLYTNFPLLLREERDRQSPVRPAFWGEGPHPPRLVVVDLVDGYTLSLRTRIYPPRRGPIVGVDPLYQIGSRLLQAEQSAGDQRRVTSPTREALPPRCTAGRYLFPLSKGVVAAANPPIVPNTGGCFLHANPIDSRATRRPPTIPVPAWSLTSPPPLPPSRACT